MVLVLGVDREGDGTATVRYDDGVTRQAHIVVTELELATHGPEHAAEQALARLASVRARLIGEQA